MSRYHDNLGFDDDITNTAVSSGDQQLHGSHDQVVSGLSNMSEVNSLGQGTVAVEAIVLLPSSHLGFASATGLRPIFDLRTFGTGNAIESDANATFPGTILGPHWPTFNPPAAMPNAHASGSKSFSPSALPLLPTPNNFAPGRNAHASGFFDLRTFGAGNAIDSDANAIFPGTILGPHWPTFNPPAAAPNAYAGGNYAPGPNAHASGFFDPGAHDTFPRVTPAPTAGPTSDSGAANGNGPLFNALASPDQIAVASGSHPSSGRDSPKDFDFSVDFPNDPASVGQGDLASSVLGDLSAFEVSGASAAFSPLGPSNVASPAAAMASGQALSNNNLFGCEFPGCKVTCGRRADLKRHKKRHCDPEYKCEMENCGFAHWRKESLKMHRVKDHGEVNGD